MKNRFLRDAGAMIFSSIATLVIGLIQTKIVSHYFSLTDFGLYSQMLLVTTIVLSFARLGLHQSPNYFIPQLPDIKDRRVFISQILVLLNIVGALSAVIVTVFFSRIVAYYDNPNLIGCRIVITFLPWFQVITYAFSSIMVAQGKARISAAITVVQSVSFCLISVLMLVLNEDIYTFIYSRFWFEFALAIVMTVIAVYSVKGFTLKPDFSLIKKILKYALPLGISDIVFTLMVETDKLFVTYYYPGEESLAIYTNMSKELPVARIAAAFTAVLLPQMVKMIKENNPRAATHLWGLVTEFSAIITGIFVSGFVVFSREIIIILYDAKYLPGISFFIVYQLILFAHVTQFNLLLNASGNTKVILYNAIGVLIANCFLNYLLNLILGEIGFAIASMICFFLIDALQLIMGSKIVNIKVRDVMPWKRLGLILCINAVFAAVFYCIRVFLDIENKSIVCTVLLGTVWGVLYLLVFSKRIIYLLKNMRTDNSKDITAD